MAGFMNKPLTEDLAPRLEFLKGEYPAHDDVELFNPGLKELYSKHKLGTRERWAESLPIFAPKQQNGLPKP